MAKGKHKLCTRRSFQHPDNILIDNVEWLTLCQLPSATVLSYQSNTGQAQVWQHLADTEIKDFLTLWVDLVTTEKADLGA